MSQESAAKPRDSESVIVEYLRKHPDFFNRHPEALVQLKVPHPTGPAVSLIERQVQVLRDENTKLRKKLQDLLKIARDNDYLAKRLQRLYLVLIEPRDLDDMMQGIMSVLRDDFSADFTALRLNVSARLGLGEAERLDPAALTHFKALFQSGNPICGQMNAAQKQVLFAESIDVVASAALLPLGGDSGWQGILAIGSRDQKRFRMGMGTVFLKRIGELVSHAIDLQVHSVKVRGA